MPRFFVDVPLHAGMFYPLPPEVVRHVQVLRLQTGAPLTLFNGSGGEYLAELVEIDKKIANVQIVSALAREVETPYRITLAQGIAGGDKMDWLIEKAVELGVAAIVPLVCTKSVVRLAGERAERRQAHWQALARAACEQCGRNRVPAVEAPRPFGAWTRDLPGQDSASSANETPLRLMLSPRAADGFVGLPALAPSLPVTLLIGPEGGLTDEEETVAREIGFTPVALGPRILRTETAGIAMLAALATRWNGW